jgi:four helix bundle protein
MLKNFKTYQLALQFHRSCLELKVPSYLRDQLLRASSSVVLNIAEGSAKPTPRDQRRFYAIALGSLRESQAALDILGLISGPITEIADQLGACLYRLCHPER